MSDDEGAWDIARVRRLVDWEEEREIVDSIDET